MTAPIISANDLAAGLPESFEVVGEIRSGGQRAVFEVSVDGERRVLKVMPAAAQDRAEREVAIGQRFDHPGLARVVGGLEQLEVNDVRLVYFTEEFIEGTALDALEAALDPCEVLELGQQLLEATEHLYEEHRVVHRDVKPPNIMRRPDGAFTLLDVGVGRHQDLTTLTVQDADHGPGTRGYLAPEQLQASKGHELDWRTDQFAIGIVLFQQLAGRLPFDPHAASYRTLLMSGIVTNWEGVPDGIRPLLERMLHAKPHRRFRLGRATSAVQAAKEASGC